MSNRFLFSLIILLLVLQDSVQRTRNCGNIECVVDADGCTQNSAGIQVCDCFVGRRGDACEIDRDECTEHNGRSPCGHRGNCINSVGSYRCDCLDGWSGSTCRTKTHPPSFDCFPGWTGRFCDSDIDECASGITQCPGPHEYCTNTDGGFNCTCDAGWEGPHCIPDSINNSMSPTAYAVIGCLAGFAFIILIIALLVYFYMRSKLKDKDQRLRQEDAKRTQMIQDRTARVKPLEPMFSIKHQMEVNDNMSAAAKINSQYRNKHVTDNKHRSEGHIGTVKPLKRNGDYSRPKKHHNSTQGRHQTDREDLNSESKWDYTRSRNYNSPNQISPAGRSSKNTRTVPVLYGTDFMSDNTWDNTRRAPNHFNTSVESLLNGASSVSSPSVTQGHISPIAVKKTRVTSDSPLQQMVHDRYDTSLILDNKWDDNRRIRNYNSSSDINHSRIFSDSSRQQHIPVHYETDPVFDF